MGSGLSDAGELDFAHTQLCTTRAAQARRPSTGSQKTYERTYLASTPLTFTGLGDTVPPQEPLASSQKDVVRELYPGSRHRLSEEKVSSRHQSQTGEPVGPSSPSARPTLAAVTSIVDSVTSRCSS